MNKDRSYKMFEVLVTNGQNKAFDINPDPATGPEEFLFALAQLVHSCKRLVVSGNEEATKELRDKFNSWLSIDSVEFLTVPPDKT